MASLPRFLPPPTHHFASVLSETARGCTKETASAPRLNDEAGVWVSHSIAAYVIFRPSVKWKCRSSFSKVLRISRWRQQSVKPSLSFLCVPDLVVNRLWKPQHAGNKLQAFPAAPPLSWREPLLWKEWEGKWSQTGSTVPVTSETFRDPGKADTNCSRIDYWNNFPWPTQCGWPSIYLTLLAGIFPARLSRKGKHRKPLDFKGRKAKLKLGGPGTFCRITGHFWHQFLDSSSSTQNFHVHIRQLKYLISSLSQSYEYVPSPLYNKFQVSSRDNKLP